MGDLRCDRPECGHLVACASCFQAGLRADGAAAERRRICEWLRKRVILFVDIDGPIIDQGQREYMADAIERGDHEEKS